MTLSGPIVGFDVSGKLRLSKQDGFRFHGREKPRLIRIMWRVWPGGGGAELVDTFRGKLTRFIPGYEHDETVTGDRSEGSIRLPLAIDGSVGVGPAIDG